MAAPWPSHGFPGRWRVVRACSQALLARGACRLGKVGGCTESLPAAASDLCTACPGAHPCTHGCRGASGGQAGWSCQGAPVSLITTSERTAWGTGETPHLWVQAGIRGCQWGCWRGFWQKPALGPGAGGIWGGCGGNASFLACWGVSRRTPHPGAALASGKAPSLLGSISCAAKAASADKAGRRWQQEEEMGLPGNSGASPCPAFQRAFQAFFLLCSQKLLRS